MLLYIPSENTAGVYQCFTLVTFVKKESLLNKIREGKGKS